MRKKLRVFVGLAVLFAASTAGLASDYQTWATGHFGAAAVADPAQELSVWGYSADPDLDRLPNLLEYTGNLDPTEASDRSELYGVELTNHPENTGLRLVMTTWQRNDDPELVVLPQVSADLARWQPYAGGHPSAWWSAPELIETIDTGEIRGVLRKIQYVTASPIPYDGTAFMRIATGIDGTGVTGPAIYPVTLTGQPFAPTATVIQSNQFIAGGFVGSVTMTVPAGVRILVNGEDRGASTTIDLGDHIWLETETPAAADQVRNHSVTIGDFSTTWNIGTRAIPPIPDHAGEESGYTQVQTNVSGTGAAQISIPIAVAPGVAGMEPKLAINYSSQGGNGMMGIGFSLSGLSAISRTGATIAQDGFKGGISFDENDRFTLDGQRLIAISGIDGSAGTEYRTEIDSFSRISSHGGNGTHAERFTVETKSGLVMEYAEPVYPSDQSVRFGIKGEFYYDIPGAAVADLESHPNFPDSPDEVRTLGILRTRQVADNYGVRLTGFITPPETGRYSINITADNSARFRLDLGSPGAPDVLEVNLGTELVNREVDLEGGRYYPLEIVHKESTADDYIELSWAGPGIVGRQNIQNPYLTTNDPTEPALGPAPVSWLISKTSDTFGNAIIYHYDSDALLNGEALITSIEYTQNTAIGLNPSQSVVFEYESRPDSQTSFTGGYSTASIKRMRAIESRHGTDLIRRYELGYTQAPLNNSTRLSSVKEIAADGVEFSPITFEWAANPAPDFSLSEDSGVPQSWPNNPPFDISPPAQMVVGDLPTRVPGPVSTDGEIQNLDYQFDDIGNLLQRRDLRQGPGNAFVENFEYDGVNRLDRYDTTGALSVLVSYNAIGNIKSRTDVGVYNYGQNGAGPHAVTSITGSFTGKNNTYTHDANGNRIGSTDTTLSYSSFNKPTSIRKGTSYLFFEYAPDRSRYQQTQVNGIATTVKDYIGGLFEREADSDGTVRNVHYIRGGSGVVAIYTSTQNTGGAAEALKTRYLHRDHLGSVESITDENGNLSERFSYDAWGQRRSVSFSDGNWTVTAYSGTPSETNRGFTGHEMLDAVGLIHMNGRVYDPVIGRFLSRIRSCRHRKTCRA